MSEKHYTYILRPLVQAPWGEMQVSITLQAPGWFEAQEKAVAELRQWKASQEQMGRTDFPWIDEAINRVEEMEGPTVFFGYTKEIDVNWYDEREPLSH